MSTDAARRRWPWRWFAGVLAIVGLTLASGWLAWFVRHAGDVPEPAADVRFSFVDMADVPADDEGQFTAGVTDGLAVRRTPEPVAALLDQVRLDANGVALHVAMDSAEGVLCVTDGAPEAACAGGARRGRCDEGASCAAGDAILAAAADVVVTDWSIENSSFERVPWRLRIWRIGLDGPEPLIELDLLARPAEAWVSPDGDVVELVVTDDDGPWHIVRCVIDEACTRSGPFDARPTIRSAMAVAPVAAGTVNPPWPEEVGVELDACQLLWPPAVAVRGRLIIDSSSASVADAGLVQLTIVRPQGEPPTHLPLAVKIDAAGPFSFVVEDPPLGFVTEPVVLGRLLAEGSCQLHQVQPDGQTAPLTSPLPLS